MITAVLSPVLNAKLFQFGDGDLVAIFRWVVLLPMLCNR